MICFKTLSSITAVFHNGTIPPTNKKARVFNRRFNLMSIFPRLVYAAKHAATDTTAEKKGIQPPSIDGVQRFSNL